MIKPQSAKWDLRFLKLSQHIARWSKDPSTKTGAVIVDPQNRVISLGFNGLPQGIHDTHQRLSNRELKYRMIVHCERNAILFAQRSLEGCTLYTWPFMSCADCAAVVIQSGIRRCVAPLSVPNERWAESFSLAESMFNEVGIQLTLIGAQK
jgi:dCMP deaminase